MARNNKVARVDNSTRTRRVNLEPTVPGKKRIKDVRRDDSSGETQKVKEVSAASGTRSK